ncbi:MAG: hypothetical protein IJ637_02095 [Prevotella sp.]|nr:hypothetical protein [Prevotella sp.]
MKQQIKKLQTIVALLLLTTSLWAAGEVTIAPSADGEATASIATGQSGKICTLTVTPNDGKYVTADNITVVRTVSGSNAQAPVRRSPEIDDTTIEVTAVDPDADPSGTTEYTFLMPGDDYDVKVTIDYQSYTTYGITVGNKAVTEQNCNDVMGNGKVAFDNKNMTLHYSDNADYVVYCSLPQLTVEVSGNASLDAIVFQASDYVEKSSLRITKAEDDTAKCSLTLTNQSGGSVLSGFGNVEIVSPLTLVTPSEVPDDWSAVAKAVISDNVEFGYGITVTGQGAQSAVTITLSNRNDVLGDGSVTFDGNETLTLNGANLEVISTAGFGRGLNISLVGDNKIKNGTKAINGGLPSLTFSTNTNEPGRLTYVCTTSSLTVANDAFAATAITYKNKLETNLIKGDGADSVTVYVPIQPIVTTASADDSEENAGAVIDFSEETQVAQDSLVNVTIDGILYTLNDTQQQNVEDDGFETDHEDSEGNVANIVVLNSVMTDEDVAELAASDKVPGTDNYAEAFKGITFLLPKGQGKIYLKNVITDDSHALQVKIGAATPVSYKTDGKYEDKEMDYDVDADTYVYIYVVEAASAAPQLAMSTRRIGPKATASGGLGGLAISASNIVVPTTKSLTGSIIADNTAGNTIVVSDIAITDIAASTFSGVSQALAYIDLTATGITGKTVDRSSGAFAGINPNTFIYLPAGNSVATGEPNVVIGTSCAKMVLDGDENHAFRVAKNFTASSVTLNRSFTEGKRSTVFLPFAVPQATANTYGDFYEFTGIAGATVNMTKVTSGGLKANTPYIFVPKADASAMSVTLAAVKSVVPVTMNFTGAYEKVLWPVDQSDKYCFVGEERDGFELGMFARMGAGSSVLPFRAYMRATGVPAPMMDINWIDNDDVTGITDVVLGSDKRQAGKDNGVFDLQGRRISLAADSQLRKGFYIVNGKKVVVR